MSAITLVVACLLLIQGLLSGQAQGAMAAMVVDPLHSICTMAAHPSIEPTDADHHSHGSSQGKSAADCPCCTLCRLAASAMPAILGADIVPARPVADARGAVTAVPDSQATPGLRGLIAEPRAPPIPS